MGAKIFLYKIIKIIFENKVVYIILYCVNKLNNFIINEVIQFEISLKKCVDLNN